MSPWDHSVSIASCLIDYDDHPYSSGYWLDDDLYGWLKEHVGAGTQDGGLRSDSDWVWTYTYVKHKGPCDNLISFRDRQKAMLFKLTWA